jgi:uncharacterized protein (DUF1015 family)
MADVRPFRALRYAPGTDLGAAICPPFDIISPEEQRVLYARSHLNAVHIELADESLGDRYDQALNTLGGWLDERALRRDDEESFYIYRQTFGHGGKTYTRSIIFARVRLEPWEAGVVLPHEQTFGGPKEDRLKLMRSIRTNTSPIYVLYRDVSGGVSERLREAGGSAPDSEFSSLDGQQHALRRVSDPATVEALAAALSRETLFIADGHHRYETALAYRDEVRAKAESWTGEEPENFVMVALTAADDPGLLVLPIHRVTNVESDRETVWQRISVLFDVSSSPLPQERDRGEGSGLALATVTMQMEHEDPDIGSIGLVESPAGRMVEAGGRVFQVVPSLRRLKTRDVDALEALLPPNRSPEWRRLAYSIANYVVLQHCLGVTPEQMRDYSVVWFTEDAEEAVEEVRSGKATYAVLMRPVPVERVLELAEAGERMPQKSTFFYPKVPTGLAFNLLEG